MMTPGHCLCPAEKLTGSWHIKHATTIYKYSLQTAKIQFKLANEVKNVSISGDSFTISAEDEMQMLTQMRGTKWRRGRERKKYEKWPRRRIIIDYVLFIRGLLFAQVFSLVRIT